MSDWEETRWEAFLARHRALEKIDLWCWVRWSRTKRFFSFRQRWQDWRYLHKFKPGQCFLDHGHEPCVLLDSSFDDGETLRGISLVDGREIWSDLYNCGPEPVSFETARSKAKEIKEERERAAAGDQEPA